MDVGTNVDDDAWTFGRRHNGGDARTLDVLEESSGQEAGRYHRPGAAGTDDGIYLLTDHQLPASRNGIVRLAAEPLDGGLLHPNDLFGVEKFDPLARRVGRDETFNDFSVADEDNGQVGVGSDGLEGDGKRKPSKNRVW